MTTSNLTVSATLRSLGLPIALAAGLSASGCMAPPEQCHGCLLALVDASPFGDATGGAPGAGGATRTGGATGSGGMVGGTGGGPGTGGAPASGGVGSGGRGTGGAATGGANSGGAATAGATGTGGTGTGGPGTGGAGVGGLGGNGTDANLVLWYKFDESSGTTAGDSAKSGGVAHDATLATIGSGGNATFSTTKQVGTHAVSLTPATAAANANGGFVTVPGLQSLVPSEVTIAVWVNLPANGSAQNWERIFDFGSGTSSPLNMYLTARAGDGTNVVRFAISTSGHSGTSEQRLDSPSPLGPGAWHHLAVVLPAGAPFTGILYIDGVAVTTNPAMTLHPSNLGATTNNWLGRSQYSDTSGSNPCLSGLLDDFRVYSRVLTAAEIATLVDLH